MLRCKGKGTTVEQQRVSSDWHSTAPVSILCILSLFPTLCVYIYTEKSCEASNKLCMIFVCDIVKQQVASHIHTHIRTNTHAIHIIE